jgi:hypothetical protein
MKSVTAADRLGKKPKINDWKKKSRMRAPKYDFACCGPFSKIWSAGRELNPRIQVLQTCALTASPPAL